MANKDHCSGALWNSDHIHIVIGRRQPSPSLFAVLSTRSCINPCTPRRLNPEQQPAARGKAPNVQRRVQQSPHRVLCKGGTLDIAIVRRPSAEMNHMRGAASHTQPECLMAVIHAGQRGNQNVAGRTATFCRLRCDTSSCISFIRGWRCDGCFTDRESLAGTHARARPGTHMHTHNFSLTGSRCRALAVSRFRAALTQCG